METLLIAVSTGQGEIEIDECYLGALRERVVRERTGTDCPETSGVCLGCYVAFASRSHDDPVNFGYKKAFIICILHNQRRITRKNDLHQ
jgi:hypothetical protein